MRDSRHMCGYRARQHEHTARTHGEQMQAMLPRKVGQGACARMKQSQGPAGHRSISWLDKPLAARSLKQRTGWEHAQPAAYA